MSKAVYSFSGSHTSASAGEFTVLTEFDLAGFTSGLFMVTTTLLTGTSSNNDLQYYLFPMNPASGSYAIETSVSTRNNSADLDANYDGGQIVHDTGQPLPRTQALAVNLRSTAYKLVMYMAQSGESASFDVSLVATD